MDALRQFNDGAFLPRCRVFSIGLEGDRITFGAGISLPLSKRDGFDEARIGALLTAAYGGSPLPSALAYIRGAVAFRSLTSLAPRKSAAQELNWY